MTAPHHRSGRRAALLGGAAAGVLLAALTAAVVLRSGRPFGWDVAVHGWCVDVRTPGLVAVARGLTATGTGVPAYAVVAAAGVLGAARRRWWAGALAAVGALAVVQVVRLGLATAVAVLWAVDVGLTRVWLGVHWPTDVLGGWLLAAVATCAISATHDRLGPRLAARHRPRGDPPPVR